MKNLSGAAAAVLAAMELLLAGETLGGSAQAEVVLAPHRAVYDLRLDGSRTGTGVVDVVGRIVYELTGSACEGYAQSMRYVTQTTNQEGETQLTDLRNSSWEAVPPQRLRFSSSTYRNDQVTEQTRGIAERDSATGAVKVDITRPARRQIEIAASTYFPIQHSMALLAAAREGKSRVAADLFDGSEGGDKVYATSTAIGRPVPPGGKTTLAQLKDGGKLDRMPSWPVSTSYFTPGAGRGDSVPLYEMAYRFHENGVTSGLRIDYGDFAIRGELGATRTARSLQQWSAE